MFHIFMHFITEKKRGDRLVSGATKLVGIGILNSLIRLFSVYGFIVGIVRLVIFLVLFVVYLKILLMILEIFKYKDWLIMFSTIPVSLIASYFTIKFISNMMKNKAKGVFASKYLKRKLLSGTGEQNALQTSKQLKKITAGAVERFGKRLGLEGLTVRKGETEESSIILPWQKLFAGLLLVGKSGAGKSSGILYPLIQEFLSLPKVCMMVGDVKGDYTQMLMKREKRAVMENEPDNSIAHPVYLLNPTDRDSLQFKLEIRTAQDAQKIARIFIRKDENDKAFFTDTARNVLSGLMIGLELTQQLNWQTLFNLVTTDDISLIYEFLDYSPEGKLAKSSIPMDAKEQFAGVMSTLHKELMFLAPIAGAWEKPNFSISDFIKKANGVVILRFDKQNEELSRKMIQVFFEMALSEISPLEDYNENTYVFFADELQNLPRLNLSYSASFLRSKCLIHVLSHQDVNKMQKLYGKEDYNSIFENMETHIVLNSGLETAEFFSRAFGDRRLLQEATNQNQSLGTGNLTLGGSKNESINDERLVHYGRIVNLPVPVQTGCATGLFKTAGVDLSELSWPLGVCSLKPLYRDFIEASWVKL